MIESGPRACRFSLRGIEGAVVKARACPDWEQKMTIVAAGARITGTFGFEGFGAGLAGGDFNGDGFADIAVNFRLIGSSRQTSASTVQIIFGGEKVFAGDLNAADLAGGVVTTSGVVDIGVGVDVPGPLFFSDVNGDGQEDLLIGAPRTLNDDPATGGASYILFGVAGDASFSLDISNLTNGIDGQAFFATGGRNAGSSFVDLGDVDGDGASELFIGAPFSSSTVDGGDPLAGVGFVFERDSDAVTDLAGAFDDPADPAAAVITSFERAFLAEDAAPLGDINGDGAADFLISGSGATGAGTAPFSGDNGEAYVIYGRNGGLPGRIDVSTLDGSNGTKFIATDIFQVGSQVASAGDINDDGFGDFMLIDAGPGSDEPVFYVVYGAEGGLGAEFDISTSDGVSKLGGVSAASVSSGVDMAAVGDVNGDGVDDIIVSRAAGGPNGRGEAALLFGSTSGLGDNVDLDDIPDGAGFRFSAGVNDFRTGLAVTGAGDLNGDGVNDLVIGSPAYNPESNADFEFDAPGAAYVIFGGADRLAALDALGGVDGVISLDDVTGDIEIPGDAPFVTYRLGPDFTVTEQNGDNVTFAVTVTRDNAEGAAEIALTPSGSATAFATDADFSRIGGSANFADGETETTVLFRLTDDQDQEPEEEIIFDLSLVSADLPGVVGDGRQIVTIQDDDTPVTFNISPDVDFPEQNGSLIIFTTVVSRSSAVGEAVVNIGLGGTAIAFGPDRDYELLTTSVTFADGELTRPVSVRVVDDAADEPNETIELSLIVVSSLGPAVLENGTQVVTLIDDDLPAPIIGDDSSERIRGGSGDDTISARGGNDIVFAGAGDDAVVGGAGADRVSGGSGNDTVVGGTGNDQLAGGNGNDRLFGQDGADDLRGGAGADRLSGGAGRDFLDGGDDNDALAGGADNDTLEGEDGNDSLFGGAGADRLDGGAGADDIDGGSGNDRASAGGGNDTVVGGAGNDLLVGGDGNDRLAGDDGADNLRGGRGADTLNGGAGRDLLKGGDDDDTLSGGSGNDTLEGEAGNDFLFGIDGADRLDGGFGADQLFGGSGADTLFGGFGDDLLEGFTERDIIFGGRGDDTLRGEAGNDVLNGGVGDDLLVGGVGDDALFGRDGADRLSGGSGDDRILGEEGADVLDGEGGDDDLSGGSGADRLVGGDGNDTLFGEDGRDAMFGGFGNDFIRGGADDDVLFGGLGRDLLSGEAGDDQLVGGANADNIFGGLGADTITGGGGDDTMVGGGGGDVFVFNQASGDDLIRDFRKGFDKIEILDGASRFGDLSITSSGGDAVISFAQTEIELSGVAPGALDASDFLFS